MPNISLPNSIVAGQAVLASKVSDNFTAILAVLNNNGLDGTNYGISAIQSNHISVNAILSQHLSDNAVVEAKIADDAITHDKLNFASASDGVRLVQLGASSTDLPAGGFVMARMSKATSITGVQSYTMPLVFSSDGMDGNPLITDTPIVPSPSVEVANVTDEGPSVVKIAALNSQSVVAFVWHSAVQTQLQTVHCVAIGGLA